MSGKIFFGISGGFLLGVFLHSLIPLGIYQIVLVFLLGISFLSVYILKKRETDIFIFLALIIFSVGLGLIRYSLVENSKDFLSGYVGRTDFYEGIVYEEPEFREKSTHLKVSLLKIAEKNTKGNVLVIVEAGGSFSYGDRIKIFGELEVPEAFETDNGRMFDYKNYLAARGVQYIFIYPKVTVIEGGQGNFFKEKIFAVKNKFVNSINQNIKAPESSLLLGLLLGVKESLGEEWDTIFRKAGLSHIVVLSGYNLTIVAVFIMWILSFLPLKPRLLAAAASIAIFAVMTGGSATVVRASAMALLVIFADFIKRRYDVTRALVVAGVAMVIS